MTVAWYIRGVGEFWKAGAVFNAALIWTSSRSRKKSVSDSRSNVFEHRCTTRRRKEKRLLHSERNFLWSAAILQAVIMKGNKVINNVYPYVPTTSMQSHVKRTPTLRQLYWITVTTRILLAYPRFSGCKTGLCSESPTQSGTRSMNGFRLAFAAI